MVVTTHHKKREGTRISDKTVEIVGKYFRVATSHEGNLEVLPTCCRVTLHTGDDQVSVGERRGLGP